MSSSSCHLHCPLQQGEGSEGLSLHPWAAGASSGPFILLPQGLCTAVPYVMRSPAQALLGEGGYFADFHARSHCPVGSHSRAEGQAWLPVLLLHLRGTRALGSSLLQDPAWLESWQQSPEQGLREVLLRRGCSQEKGVEGREETG